MNNDKSILSILTDTLEIVASRAMTAEREREATAEDSNNWYSYYTTQKARADKLEQELQATRDQLQGESARADRLEAERNTARAELAALKGAEDHE